MNTFTYSSTGTAAFVDAFASLSIREMEVLLPKLTQLRNDARRKGGADKIHRKPRNRPRKQHPVPAVEYKELSLSERLDLPLRAPRESDPACQGDCVPYSELPFKERLTRAQLDREMDEYWRTRVPSAELSEALRKQFPSI